MQPARPERARHQPRRTGQTPPQAAEDSAAEFENEILNSTTMCDLRVGHRHADVDDRVATTATIRSRSSAASPARTMHVVLVSGDGTRCACLRTSAPTGNRNCPGEGPLGRPH